MHPDNLGRTAARGFTLIEVVIALFILALGLAAATQLASNSANDVRHLTRVTYAHWVAMNRLSELELQTSLPAKGVSRGKSQEAGITWYWQQAVSDTPITDLIQVEVRVRAKPEGPVLTSVRSILGKALAQGQNTPTPGTP